MSAMESFAARPLLRLGYSKADRLLPAHFLPQRELIVIGSFQLHDLEHGISEFGWKAVMPPAPPSATQDLISKSRVIGAFPI